MASVLGEHLYGNSADQPEGGMLIGGNLIGFPGIVDTDLDGSGAYTGANGAAFTLVSDGGSGSIFTVTALPNAAQTITFTNASGDAFWDINSSFSDDWNDGIGAVDFFDGDHVTFDDTAGGLPGTLSISFDEQNGVILPGSITVSNSAGNDYEFTGQLYGNAPLTKTGEGTLRFAAPDANMPYGGAMTLNGGVVELANESAALRNTSATVNSGASFRVLGTTTGQDLRNPALTLAGGTLDIEDRSFFYNTITLAAGTTSTINTDEELITWAGPPTAFGGSGNLIKTGADFLAVTGRDATYTGTTTIEDGEYRIQSDNTAASSGWTINGGFLNLQNDSGAPIENLIGAPPVTINGGELQAIDNTETIGTLAMDSTSATTALAIANHGDGTTPALLTVDTLDLTGTSNFVSFDITPGAGTYDILNATTVNGTLGTNLLVAGVPPSSQTWGFTGGVVSVTIAYTPNTITYTNLSGNATWTLNGDTDWTDGSAIGYFDTDHVTFDDSATGLPGTLTVDIPAAVTPSSVTFSNTTGNNYAFTGSSIAGPGGLTKNGAGAVTLSQPNTFTGPTIVNAGTLVLDHDNPTLSDDSAVTVNSGAVLQVNKTNAIFRTDLADAGITVDGGTLEFTETGAVGSNTHGHLPSLTLRDGALITATSGGGFSSVNTDFDGDVTVEGTSPSTIGPFNLGFRFNNFSPEFNVADVTGDGAIDLFVDGRIRGNSGFTKTGAGTMYIAANPFNDTDYTTTTVTSGCLLIEDLSAIPADLTQVSVGAGACFGGIAGGSNLSEADLLALASDVVWDAGGDARLVIDTDGQTVDVTAAIAGNFKIIATGDGTLNLNGGATVNDIIIEGTTTVNLPSGATTIAIESIVTTPDGANTDVTLTFDADGEVDIYGTDNLTSWTKLNVSPVAGGDDATYTVEDLADPRQFFVIVSAGEVFPAP